MNAIHPHVGCLPVVRESIVGIEQCVPLLNGSRRTYVNLDNAATTPALREVTGAVAEFLEWYSSVHRGSGFKARMATHAYEEARQVVGDFVGANKRDHLVIFGKNATEAINKLAWRLDLAQDDVVLVSRMEHHSNDLPWRARAKVVHIGLDRHGGLDEEDFDRQLRLHAGRVRLVAVSGGSNVTGHMPDVHRLAVRAHAAGAQILVDCAQLAPHRRIHIRPLEDPAHLDYVALSAHKMYAPFGCGALIGRRDTFARGEPEYRGGGTISFVTLDEVAWASGPDRDEAGTPNAVGAVALAAAMHALEAIGMESVAHHEAVLTAHALERLGAIPGLRIYGDPDPRRATQRLGVIPFNIEGLPHGLVAAVLGAEFGIGVRNGCFCAHPCMLHLLGLTAAESAQARDRISAGDHSSIPGMVRLSFGCYNTLAEVDLVADALGSIARRAYRGTYEVDAVTGEHVPRGFLPELHGPLSLLGRPDFALR
ncbi:class V aminotransferase [Siccirubricoccus deserti]|uniref:Aminotransferase class V-fold PLP-dependent enzyme n=1 Tax=Siccirubricoccus deserti TaxID=2013562 RepID=A0A9X0UFW0_9PROT|nr:aminotransferase class V-fold PLP-dependent enzyme [Siccirubricoccus deserti]MBC4018386.1 aminotransferase class V-fold PLP-dependent enzyme [Siccirubricoccus deserti]GGC65037.1 class V aminotransferase [Siccirubricoccus deserti]